MNRLPLAFAALVVACVAATSLTCTGGLKTKLCGAPGQPCCAAQACDDGARCTPDNTCETCGARDQACCPGDACQGGLACQAHVCSDALTCTDPCTLGALRCQAATNGVDACQAVGLCPAWKTLVATCPNGTVCEGTGGAADCVDRCITNCVPNSLQCTVSGLTRCVQGASDSCPALQAEQDNADNPACIGGASAGADVVWESPTPFLAPIRALAGELSDSYWVLDTYGNIIHNYLGAWLYEQRVEAGGHPMALASCKLGSKLFAVGQAGRAWKRNGDQTWSLEATGATETLRAAACDSYLNVFAVGDSSRLYLRKAGVWSSVDTGIPGPYYGIGYLFSLGKAWLVGPGGKVTRCDGLGGGPITCQADTPPGATGDFTAAWGDDLASTVYVVGDNGAIREKGAVWLDHSVFGLKKRFLSLHGVSGSASSFPVVMASGESGTVAVMQANGTFDVSTVGTSAITAAHVTTSQTLLVGNDQGDLWAAQSSYAPSWAPRGGSGPITADLFAVTGTGNGRLFAVGAGGARVRRENEAWVPDTAGLATTVNLFGVTAPWQGEVYAVGADGTVLVRRFGTWADDTPHLTTGELWAVDHDATRMVAVGAGGVWLEKTGPTGAWTKAPQTLVTASLNAVAFHTDSRGATLEAVAGSGACELLSKKGDTFSKTAIPGCSSPIYAVRFTSAGELYVGTADGELWRRTTTGFQQEFLGLGGGESVLALVSSGGSVWALGRFGQMFRRTASWQDWAKDLTASNLFAGFNDPDHGLFVVGSGGLVWRKP